METVCQTDSCAGCMLCRDVCPNGAICVHTGIYAYNAEIDREKCSGCGMCRRLCPQNNPVEFRGPAAWYQGWSADPAIRAMGSSGGLATAVAKGFIARGGEVCTCVFERGNFVFRFFDDPKELSAAAGSKYVKSDPSGVYMALADRLDRGKKVLLIALPCQIAAARRSVGDRDLYTVDLICHGTPAPQMLRTFFAQRGVAIEELLDVRFRVKDSFNLSDGYKAVEPRITDEYTYAFLKGMTYTENCYHCPYARLERVSDLTLGDCWGSLLPKDERDKGISLILCQTEKGRELLEMSGAKTRPVDIMRAVEFNHQLREPMTRLASGYRFVKNIEKGKSFALALLYAEPVRAVKNMLKKSCPWARRSRGGT